MTDQTNAELIAELRGFAGDTQSARASLMRDAADALEAAEKRAAQAERENRQHRKDLAEWEKVHAPAWIDARDRQIAEARAERNQLAAVVEQARLYCENQGDKFRHHAGRILDMLAASPADALREVKADAWDEGHSWGWSDAQDAHDVRQEMKRSEWRLSTSNPYRAREEQDRG